MSELRRKPEIDFYKVLQVDTEAEPEVVEAAYRALSKKYHPDINPLPEAQARMSQINSAYEILGDTAKRRDYNLLRGGINHYIKPPATTATVTVVRLAPLTARLLLIIQMLMLTIPAARRSPATGNTGNTYKPEFLPTPPTALNLARRTPLILVPPALPPPSKPAITPAILINIFAAPKLSTLPKPKVGPKVIAGLVTIIIMPAKSYRPAV